ncbi:MAG TPA: transposase [Anaerolineales bacterium]|nr:transposase [Anaerolineales bacterium]
MNEGSSKWAKAQEGRAVENRCWEYLRPLLEELHKKVDRRLAKTMLDLVLVILMHRNRNNGLLLSELGDHLVGGDRGPAGVKRIASLLHSKRWRSGLIVQWLWERGNEKVKELREQNEEIYVIWDESVLEKSESLQAERLCAVRSSKAARLKRIKPGYFNPPGGRPIFVPGFNWLQLLVTGMKGTPVLAHLCWWTTRGKNASSKRDVEGKILRKVARLWGRKVVHVWDRGFAGSPWTSLALDHHVRFIVRWNIRYHLVGPDGHKREGWKIARGKRSWEQRLVWDARRRCKRKTGIVAFPVHLPDDERPLFLVVSRPGSGRKPWYLLTSEPVYTSEQAWKIVFAYARRWQIEMSLRFTKSEMAFESPRLLAWQARLKFLLIASLAYAFLLSLLPDTDFLFQLLSSFCHRTGKWSQDVLAPLYRLRLALSRLWLLFRPHSLPSLTSG